MIEFPTLMYRTPGPHSAGGTKTFDYIAAADEVERDVLSAEGWHPTMDAAFAPSAEPEKTGKAEK